MRHRRLDLLYFNFIPDEIWKQWFVYHVIWHGIKLIRFVASVSWCWNCPRNEEEEEREEWEPIMAFNSEWSFYKAKSWCLRLACAAHASGGGQYELAPQPVPFVIERGNFMVIITVVACHYYSVCSQKVKFDSLFIPMFLRSHFSSSSSLAL